MAGLTSSSNDATTKGGPAPPLPDPSVSAPAYRRFVSDPGLDEAWWWLGFPAASAAGILGAFSISPDLFFNWLLPEGYGILELGHFLIPLSGFVIALRLLARPFVRQRKLIVVFLALSALACLYIAGEEQSWGQHFFQWKTPDYWAKINRQQETNLHNIHYMFGQLPRHILERGIFMGGLLLPILALFWDYVRCNRLSLFLPASALFATALAGLFFKIDSMIVNKLGVRLIPIMSNADHYDFREFRSSEITETYLYLFILFYLIVFARRINELEREAGPD